METFSRDGLTFDVTDAGAGEPVVLLHGFPQNRHSWDEVTALLTGCRTLAPDQRGYSPGARPAGRRAYVTSQLVGDVLALLDAAGLASAHVVGHDWGAQVAWSLASKHPDRVRTLTTLSVPHPQAFVQAMRHGQALRSWYMLAFQLPWVPETFLTRSGSRGSALGLTEEQVTAYLDGLGRDGLHGALNWYRALPFSQREHGYGRPIEVPTTFVWGDRDPALGRAGAEATGAFVTADYRFEVVPGAGHWLPERHADLVAELILDRLRREHPHTR